jgi:hypothetical protein
MKDSKTIGQEFIKELRETLASNSQKLKWHRIAMNERSNGIYKVTSVPTAIPTILMDRYLRENNES